MNTHTNKSPENTTHSAAEEVSQKQQSNAASQFADNRPETAAQRKMQQLAEHYSSRVPSLLQAANNQHVSENNKSDSPVIQRVIYPNMPTMWAAVIPGTPVATVTNIINQSPALQQAYNDCAANLASMDFLQAAGTQPNAATDPNVGGDYDINYGLHGTLAAPYDDLQQFVGAMLHEMMHISTAVQYNQNAAVGGIANIANMNLPAAVGAVLNPLMGLDAAQIVVMHAQLATMDQNWTNLTNEIIAEHTNGTISDAQRDFLIGPNNLTGKLGYAQGILPLSHYDTVLTELIYYFINQGLNNSRTGQYTERLLAEANARRTAGIGAVVPVARAWNWACYITTACVQYKGLPDDCEELTLLRSFRDNYLLARENGKELLRLYYDHAPLILQSISRRHDEDEILARLYKIIKQCAEEIKNGNNEIAYLIYCRMVVKLKEEFIPGIMVYEENNFS
ncbi:MAG: CFI-box-CTERM domain-containing protein [Bacteroidia bacterium]